MFLYQPASGYRYNSDSIFLYDFAASFRPKDTLLDVGCGVGILSLLLSRDFALRTTIIDKQEKMLGYAKHNFDLNGLEVKAYLGDFLSFESDEKFDTIISNPPFYDSEVTQSEDEHLNAARYAHHLPFSEFVQKAKKLLKPRGRFIFCYDAKQVDGVLSDLKLNNINPEVIRFVHAKIDRESKLVMIAARMSSRSMTKVMPPLVVFDAESRYLPEAQRAFEMAETHSIKGERVEFAEQQGYNYRFDPAACTSCGGHCCTGESGYIWVKYHEMEAIAEFLERSVEDFATIYLKKVKHRYSLMERKREQEDDFACIFFDDALKGCSIYPVRPLQCRTFPFWDQFKNDIKEVQKECPGIIEKQQ